MMDVVLCLMNGWRWTRRCVTKFFFVFLFCGLASQQTFAGSLSNFTFLSLADIHFDPFIACYGSKIKPCPVFRMLVDEPIQQWPTILKKFDTRAPAHGLDTGYPLFMKTLADAKNIAAKNNVAFAWVLGDFLGHDFKRYYRKYSQDQSYEGYTAFMRKTMAFIAWQINAAFPTIDVYPVLGNDDTLHYNYQVQPSGPGLNALAAMWSPFIKSSSNRMRFLSTFSIAGYYAVSPATLPNLKIIALDSVIFSHKSKKPAADAAAKQELIWLNAQLNEAERAGQRVFIIMHIPVSIDFNITSSMKLFTIVKLWKTPFVSGFEAILQKHQAVIDGIFSGHLHENWFHWLSFNEEHSIAQSGTISVAPIFGNDPGFKVFSYEGETGEIEEAVNATLRLDDFPPAEFDSQHYDENGESCETCGWLSGLRAVF